MDYILVFLAIQAEWYSWDIYYIGIIIWFLAILISLQAVSEDIKAIQGQ